MSKFKIYQEQTFCNSSLLHQSLPCTPHDGKLVLCAALFSEGIHPAPKWTNVSDALVLQLSLECKKYSSPSGFSFTI